MWSTSDVASHVAVLVDAAMTQVADTIMLLQSATATDMMLQKERFDQHFFLGLLPIARYSI